MVTSQEKEGRRGFLKFSMLGFGAIAGAPALVASSTPASSMSVFGAYPRTKIGSLAALKKEGELDFYYPDASSTCKAVYVNKNVKAYSTICTHKGCPTVYDKTKAVFECPCHFTKYDALKDGQMIIGHAAGGLPRVLVEVKGDDIFAIGVDGLIFGRINNTVG